MILSNKLINLNEDKINIAANTRNEYDNIRALLESAGYTWNSGHLPTQLGDDYYYHHSHYIGVNITRKYINIGPYSNIKSVNYDDILSKKINTIY